MATVEAHLFYWSSEGMRPAKVMTALYGAAYVQVEEVERLLEEAHARGRREGAQVVAAVVAGTPA
jgi:hypothetical protein